VRHIPSTVVPWAIAIAMKMAMKASNCDEGDGGGKNGGG